MDKILFFLHWQHFPNLLKKICSEKKLVNIWITVNLLKRPNQQKKTTCFTQNNKSSSSRYSAKDHLTTFLILKNSKLFNNNRPLYIETKLSIFKTSYVSKSIKSKNSTSLIEMRCFSLLDCSNQLLILYSNYDKRELTL